MSYRTELSQLGFKCHKWHDKRLREYYKRMSSDDLGVVFDDNVADVLRAQGFNTQESPRSIYRVDKLYEALHGYAPNNSGQCPREFRDSKDLAQGLALAYSCFAKPKDQPFMSIMKLDMRTIWEITSNPTGSPGLTAYGLTKSQAQDKAYVRAIETLHKLRSPEPCLAFKRTQFNDKTRLVWGYPYSMTVIEGLVAYPLLQRFKHGTTPMAFAMTSMALGTKLRVASYHKRWAYSLDYSQFDATIPSWLIHKAFNILRTWFNPLEVEPTSGMLVGYIFDLIEKYFIHTPIVMPNGIVVRGKDHGVPSGSYFTQIIDSIVNVIVAGAISSAFWLKIDRHELFVLGDDILLWSDRCVDLDAVADYVRVNFNLKLHGSEKSTITHYSEPVHFLGRVWTNGLPGLDVDGILQRMFYPERFRRYSKDAKKREREVKLLLLSFAAQYREGWSIAQKALGYDVRNIARGCAPTILDVYASSHRREVDPDHLSGLMRYRQKYVHQQVKRDYPIVATQYWL